MSKKICVFVDGENFRHSIVELFNEFKQEDYLPRNAKWEEFYDWLITKIDSDGQRVRTYWYVIGAIDFFPYRFPKKDKEPDKLKALLCKDNTCNKRLESLSETDLINEMGKIVNTLEKNHHLMVQRFNGWSIIQSGISTKHRFIEFRKAGAIQYNLFNKELGSEKAVDVKLATDMIMLKDIYDIAVIVSGDQDYVPAVQVIKDLGKHVVNVSFETRGGKLLPGGAWRLNQITDWSLRISYGDFKPFLNLSP